MKKSFLVLVLCLCSLASGAQDYDFSAEAPTGQTLYYKIFENVGYLSGIPAVKVVRPIEGGQWGYADDAPTGDLTIPRAVRYNDITYYVVNIYYDAFEGCSGLTSVTIPSSVSTIESHAFDGCSGLIYVVLGSSVGSFDDVGNIPDDEFADIDISNTAFYGCTNLITIYSLYPASCTSGKFANAERMITASFITTSGGGANRVYQLDEYYHIERDGIDGGGLPEEQLVTGALPVNFIAKRRGSWFAREILLTDGKDEFRAPIEFAAAKATYTRSYTQGNRSTLCLPFKPTSVSSTGDLNFYAFSDFDGSTITFSEVAFDDLEANTPYMVEWPATKTNADFVFTARDATIPATPSVTSRIVTHGNGKFIGTMERKCMNSTNYGYKDGFFVRSADNSSIFPWDDQCSGHAHVNPFRAYFEITSGDAPQSLPRTLNVEVGYGDPVGIDAAETPEQEYVNRYGKDVYDMLGRLVRKNADNLEGLPRGIYLWKGKKNYKN